MKSIIGKILSLHFIFVLTACSSAVISKPTSMPAPTATARPPRSERPFHFQLMLGNTVDKEYIYRAFLQSPIGMAWGKDGYLYVADWMGRHIVRVLPDGSMDDLPTWKDPAIWQVDGPRGIAFSPNGTLYVSDHNNIYAIDENGVATKLGGVSASLIGSIAFGPSGELYYSDRNSGKIYRWDEINHSTLVVEGLNAPDTLIYAPDGNIYVNLLYQGKIVRLNTTTKAVEDFHRFRPDPVFMTIDATGDLWTRGFYLGRYALDGTEKTITVDGQAYSGQGTELRQPGGLAFDDQGGLYVASYCTALFHLTPIEGMEGDATFTRENIASGFEGSSIDLGSKGEVYVTNVNTDELWQINPDGIIKALELDNHSIREFSKDDRNPSSILFHGGGRAGVAVDPSGQVYIGLPRGEIVRLEEDWSFSHYANVLADRMMIGGDGALYAVAIDLTNRFKSIVRITGVDQVVKITSMLGDVPFNDQDIHITPAPGGLYVFTQRERNLFFMDYTGKGNLILNLSSLGGATDNPAAFTSAPNGDVYIILHGPYDLSRISPSGKITKVGSRFDGDPWDMVVSADGKYLYILEVGAVERISIE